MVGFFFILTILFFTEKAAHFKYFDVYSRKRLRPADESLAIVLKLFGKANELGD